MKKKLLFALSLLLSFITSAQRIDYALNHQDGINIVSPIQLRVVSDNIFLVSYKGIDENRNISFFISVVASDGRVLSTNQLQDAGQSDYLNFDITTTGTNLWYTRTISFGSNPFYTTYHVDANSFDSRFGNGKFFYDYHNDSVTLFNLATNAIRFAFVDKKEQTKSYLHIGHIVLGKYTKEINSIELDSQSTYWSPNLKWLNNNSLYLNSRTNGIVYHFGDSNNIVGEEQVLKCERPVLFKNQLYDLKNNFVLDDTLTSMLLRNSSGATVHYLDCKSAWQPYGKLLSTPQNLISIHQQSQNIGSVKYDSLIINYFDTTLKHIQRIPVASPTSVSAIEVDSVSGQLVIYGRGNDEIVLMLVGKNGIVSGVNPILMPQRLTVYPNPVGATLNVSLPQNAHKINIYTVTGSLVLSMQAATAINVSELPAGLFWVEVLGQNNTRLSVAKVVKQ